MIIEKIVAGTAQRRPAFIETSQLAPFLAMAEPIRVAVVDPYPIFRDAVVQTIARTDGLALAGEGSSIADARRLARESGADIVTFDISTSEGGIDASKPICKSDSDCKLIVLTALDDAMRVSHAIAAGARGYILKGVTGQELVAAIKLVHAGQPYITAELASRMAFGPLAGGWVFDSFDAYSWLFIGSSAVGLGAVAVALAFPPLPSSQRQVLQPA